MFSFRRDIVGFIAGLTLMGIVGLAAVLTLVFGIVAWAVGDWAILNVSVRWILGVAWVLCIATVLTRVYIFQWQMKKREQGQAPQSPAPEPLPQPSDASAGSPEGRTPGGDGTNGPAEPAAGNGESAREPRPAAPNQPRNEPESHA